MEAKKKRNKERRKLKKETGIEIRECTISERKEGRKEERKKERESE